jgi:hypothetical protein
MYEESEQERYGYDVGQCQLRAAVTALEDRLEDVLCGTNAAQTKRYTRKCLILVSHSSTRKDIPCYQNETT